MKKIVKVLLVLCFLIGLYLLISQPEFLLKNANDVLLEELLPVFLMLIGGFGYLLFSDFCKKKEENLLYSEYPSEEQQ